MAAILDYIFSWGNTLQLITIDQVVHLVLKEIGTLIYPHLSVFRQKILKHQLDPLYPIGPHYPTVPYPEKL